MGIDNDKLPLTVNEMRRRAEELLRAKTAEEHLPRTEEEAQRLVHELEVHQIELEMQNAELHRARDARHEVDSVLDRYTDLYDFAPVGYFTLDRVGIISAVNLSGASLIGIERSHLIGRRIRQFVAQDYRTAFTTFIGKVFTGTAKVAFEAKLLKVGNPPLFVRFEAVAAASGLECRMAVIDITERRQMEEALRESEERLRLLIDGVKDYAIFVLDVDGRVTCWNEGARQLKGWDAHEILGRHFSLFYPEEAVAAGHPAHELKRAATEGRYEEDGWRVRKDGSKFMANVIITAIRDESGKLRGFSKITRDITERKRVEDALRQAKEAAEANARTKSQFLANMSHELRTPMTGILGMLQLALGEELAPAPREYLETTLSAARSLLRILNDILDMAKIEAGKLVFEETPFFLRTFIADAVKIIAPEVRLKGLDFTISVATEVPDRVFGDQVRLRQVLINLIGNAVKFTEGGTVALRVTAGGTSPDGKREFTFAVTDTGIGIPDEKKDLLFRTFSQVDASHTRRYGGTGLGLAISREIVELMGGTIGFESEAGVGSTFTFTIPLGEAGLKSDALPAAEPLLFPETTTPAPEGERFPRLLLAEDDPTIRKVLGLMFARSNFNIDFAEDGLKAVEMWERGNYDLVLMDIQMPRLNGFEATSAIREKERERGGGHIPIIAMTAHVFKEDKERCFAAGMDAYIPKPIDFKKCVEEVRKLLDK